ncbi:MAG: acyl-CoA dehydrogenase family protein, partial [Pseudomonadales bacterium]|nr:acyl-CoA dehydrogenase family protein [Pseudomonadales bacterium]
MLDNVPSQAASDSKLISRARSLAPVVGERARECEALRRVPDQTIEDFHQAGLFRAIQPKRIGGSQVPFPVYFKMCSEIARGCASSAWVLTNLASHHWMLTYWPVEAQDEVWGGSPDVLIASGLAFPCGKASKVAGGYRLTGKWPFSSGVDASSWNLLGGIVASEGAKKSDQRLFLIPSDNYNIIDDWDAAGLKGSGSKSVA